METSEQIAQIQKIGTDYIEVAFQAFSACGSCSLHALCSSKESCHKTMKIRTEHPSDFSIGEKIRIQIDSSAGLIAALYAYFLPLILLVITVSTTFFVFGNENWAGISGIIILIPYYFGLFLKQKYFKNRFTYHITKIKS